MARWRKDFSSLLWTGKETLCNDLIEWLPNDIAFQCAIARCIPKSTVIESIHDLHQWHQWVECRTVLTPRVIMRNREVLWVEIASDTRERRLRPYEFHSTPGTRPRWTKTARSQDSLLGALWSYNGNSSEKFTEKLTVTSFQTFQFYKQKLGNKVGAEERPRAASELSKIQ